MRRNINEKANYYELIINAKNKIMMLENEAYDAEELIDLVRKEVRKTLSINIKASLITVLFIGYFHQDEITGNIIFYMPLTKDCLNYFKYVRKRISKGKAIKVEFNKTREIDGDYCYGIDVVRIY